MESRQSIRGSVLSCWSIETCRAGKSPWRSPATAWPPETTLTAPLGAIFFLPAHLRSGTGVKSRATASRSLHYIGFVALRGEPGLALEILKLPGLSARFLRPLARAHVHLIH